MTYVCRRRPAEGASPVDKDGMVFSIAFEIVDEEIRAELGKKKGVDLGSS